MKSEDSSMKIFKLFYVLECQGGQVKINITIHLFNIRGSHVQNSVLNFLSWYFMSIGVDNPVLLICHVKVYTGVSSQCHHQWVSNISVSLWIPIIGRLRIIWDKVFSKIKVSFDGLVIRKVILSESIHRIDTYLDVLVEFLKFWNNVPFEFYLDDQFIEISHATNFL